MGCRQLPLHSLPCGWPVSIAVSRASWSCRECQCDCSPLQGYSVMRLPWTASSLQGASWHDGSMTALLLDAQHGGCLQAALLQGLGTLSQADVGSALQVYFNLDELNEVGEGACQCATWQVACIAEGSLQEPM